MLPPDPALQSPQSPLARFAVTEDQIRAVVTAFYDAVRRHPGLGPVFAAHVTDWPAHEARIVAFWANAILYERGYEGNPLAVHRRAGNVRPGMFEPWLALFDATLRRELAPETAEAWSVLAHRIGAGLRYGLVEATPKGQPPILR
ncbi:group III truncated hemoglobin [Xinfangfangia sp. CPCC 101601]|uniref:Group III truncated hemoglobin n=1 Tax=Pseudogemmobacter lacusdianii TaxID=3069608 RepID=A0ABU0VWF3_9RHOB|nr:group III truncated hemoglobin [Xinfangfangia sp. CPCC 101601]MDQ2066086.1 group III truncated hemoglobin [Xinfangfangia sp. CPCC 101601]